MIGGIIFFFVLNFRAKLHMCAACNHVISYQPLDIKRKEETFNKLEFILKLTNT